MEDAFAPRLPPTSLGWANKTTGLPGLPLLSGEEGAKLAQLFPGGNGFKPRASNLKEKEILNTSIYMVFSDHPHEFCGKASIILPFNQYLILFCLAKVS